MSIEKNFHIYYNINIKIVNGNYWKISQKYVFVMSIYMNENEIESDAYRVNNSTIRSLKAL